MSEVYSALRTLANIYDNNQKQRIAMGNQLAAMDRGESPDMPAHRRLLELWQTRFHEYEQAVLLEMGSLLKSHPAYADLRAIKGMGPSLCAKLLAPVNIHETDTVSSLWRYAGQGVADDGQRDRPKKGEKMPYNPRLKSVCYLISASFLKTDSPYRRVYDDARAYYGKHRPEWTAGHIHLASMRKMVKVFLSHLWSVWREREGLPTRRLYVHEYLGHTQEYTREEFGWKSVDLVRQEMEAAAAAETAAPAPKRGRARKGAAA